MFITCTLHILENLVLYLPVFISLERIQRLVNLQPVDVDYLEIQRLGNWQPSQFAYNNDDVYDNGLRVLGLGVHKCNPQDAS